MATAKTVFLLIFVFDIISGSVMVLLMEGDELLFIISRPMPKNKREMPEMQRKSLTEHQPTSCPEPAGMSLRDDQLQDFRIEA